MYIYIYNVPHLLRGPGDRVCGSGALRLCRKRGRKPYMCVCVCVCVCVCACVSVYIIIYIYIHTYIYHTWRWCPARSAPAPHATGGGCTCPPEQRARRAVRGRAPRREFGPAGGVCAPLVFRPMARLVPRAVLRAQRRAGPCYGAARERGTA